MSELHRSSLGDRLRRWLLAAPAGRFSAYAVLAAFATYFCMYAFRKPWAVARFEGRDATFLGTAMELKALLIIAQTIGYATSKFLGVGVCSSLKHDRRAITLVGLIACAELALLTFPFLPDDWKWVALLLNGLPLGMVWGIVFSFLEGRRTSDLLGAGLSCSYIVASGAVKTVGEWWMIHAGVSETWMPFVTGASFAPLFLLSVWFLEKLPEPSAADRAERSERTAMDSSMRWGFLGSYKGGMIPLLVLYFFLTAYRDFRDTYAKDIWFAMGMGNDPSVLTLPELYIAFLVLLSLAMLYRVKGNRAAVIGVYGIMTGGMLLVLVSTFAYDEGWITGYWWMLSVGLGLYLAYVPFGCVLFDRLVALLRSPGNAVFGIYLSDALGYTGSICVMAYKQFGRGDLSPIDYFKGFSYLCALICIVSFVLSLSSFLRHAGKVEGSPADA